MQEARVAGFVIEEAGVTAHQLPPFVERGVPRLDESTRGRDLGRVSETSGRHEIELVRVS